MYFDDFIAQQTMKTNRSAPPVRDSRRSGPGLFRPLWDGVRRFVWGIDALTRVQHGIDVPPDHGARTCPSSRRPQ